MEEIKKKARHEFDSFLKETLPEFAPHLIDTDENAGERFREKLDAIIDLAVSKERERHLKELNNVLNKHSKPSTEGGLDYVKAFEEMEKYEQKLFNLINTK